MEKVVVGSKEYAKTIEAEINEQLKGTRNYCYTEITNVPVVTEE